MLLNIVCDFLPCYLTNVLRNRTLVVHICGVFSEKIETSFNTKANYLDMYFVYRISNLVIVMNLPLS